MDDATDDQLLAEYARGKSADAFAQMVRRHVDMVYAAARRQVRDAHLAEDVTQSVFIVLSKRAANVPRGALAGWLIKTTRYSAMNAVKLQVRRRIHEQRAAELRGEEISMTNDEPKPGDLAGALDEGLARLGERDRTAVAMRYLQGKTTAQIAREMGTTESAAQRRIHRAVLKLRSMYARRGITTEAEAISAHMATQAMNLAPAALAMNIAGTMTESGTTSALAAATLRTILMAKIKLAAMVCGAIVFVAGSAAVVKVNAAQSAKPQAAAAAVVPGVDPLKIAKDLLTPSSAPAAATTFPFKYENSRIVQKVELGVFHSELDPNVSRTGKEPAALVRTVDEPKVFETKVFLASVEGMQGKKIRVTAWIKTQDVQRWVGLGVFVLGPGGRMDMSDSMSDRPIRANADWKQYSSVVEVLPDSTGIVLGLAFAGQGTVWIDGIEINEARPDEQCTDDRRWHVFSRSETPCTAVLDDKVKRNGHPTTKFSMAPGKTRWSYYDRGDRHIEQFLGKKVKLSAWLKHEAVVAPSGLSINVNGPMAQKLNSDVQKGKRPLRGTGDWKKYETIADVPLEAQSIFTGLELTGSGTIWIDDVKVEVVK